MRKDEDDKALEELLLHAAEQGWDPDGPELEAAFGDRHAELEDARDWLRTQAVCERFGRDEEALVEALVREPRPEDRDRRTIEAFFGPRLVTRNAPRGIRLPSVWQLAAGILIVVGATFWLARDPAPRDTGPGIRLGTGTIGGLEPAGRVPPGTPYGAFRWDAVPLPPGGRYRLVVESGGEEILRAEGLEHASFAPTTSQTEVLEHCEEITWRVYALEADGRAAPLAAGSARVSRR